jgi:hypothetical protein
MKPNTEITQTALTVYFDRVVIDPSATTPTVRHTPGTSQYKSGRWKTTTYASSEVIVPSSLAAVVLNHVTTLVPARHVRVVNNRTTLAASAPATMRSWWFRPGRGKQVHMVEGLYHVPTGTHAEDRESLARLIARQARAEKAAQNKAARLARAKRTRLPLLVTSQKAGNCLAGTIGFLQSLGIKRDLRHRKATYAAVERLARRHGMANHAAFARVAGALI